jgi:hypothetical protein
MATGKMAMTVETMEALMLILLFVTSKYFESIVHLVIYVSAVKC